MYGKRLKDEDKKLREAEIELQAYRSCGLNQIEVRVVVDFLRQAVKEAIGTNVPKYKLCCG